MLDPRISVGTEGAICIFPALLLDHLEFLEEQGSCQEPAHVSLTAGFSREACCRERRLWPACVREADDIKGMGGGSATEGHALSLPQPIQPSSIVDRRLAGSSQDSQTDLRAGNPDKNVREILSGRTDGKDLGLGRRRVRRLHAELRI